jgi:RNA polymerase sigma-70 factor (ECF subfamily)
MTQSERQSAFEALLQPILSAAYSMAYNLTHNRDEASDLVQETSLLAFRGFHTFQPGTNFKAWFFRIMTNQAIQQYRKRRREPEIKEIEDVPELYLYQHTLQAGLHGRNQDPVSTVLGKIDGERIAAALAALPEEFRVVCALYFTQELSYQEIADQIGIPVGTVRSRLHRARGMLQKALWEIAEADGIVATVGAKRG